MTEGFASLPAGEPERTLGWGVVRHAATVLRQPNGPKAGQQWVPTLSQFRFMLWWYAVDEDGRWLFHHGARRLAKGSGKSPHAAVLALMELVGPVRLKDFDPKVSGGCVGKPVDMPLVQIAATAESQTANTMRMVRAMAGRGSRIVAEYGLDVGKTIIYTPNGGVLEVITSSWAAAEGAEVTFAVEDETEHWAPGNGGPQLASVLDRNLAKSSSRAVETANAWEPGSESVAEATYDAWVAQQEGRARGESRILYDARIAPADTVLADEASLEAALQFVYDDCFWVDRRTIRERIWDPRTAPDISRRFYLNQPTAPADSWVTPMEWAALTDVTRVVADGEEIALFFDGSKSQDATALVGCCLSDGHVFTLGVWEPDGGAEVDVGEVDETVAAAFDKYQPLGFFGDVREWESFTKLVWPERHADALLISAVAAGKDPQPIAWDMRSRTYEFTLACELTEAEVRERAFSHDGDSRVARHVGNARRRLNRWGTSISKESRQSPKKIDAAVCVVGARMVRRAVLASTAWEKRQRFSAGRGRVIALS